METSKLNDWLQILTSIGVLAGLVLVAYEIRQVTDFAKAESSRETYSGWAGVSQTELETNIGDIVIRSIEDPESLSPHDLFKYYSWLAMIMYQYDQGVRLYDYGVLVVYGGISDVEAQYYFSSKLSRLWFERAKSWIRPANAKVIAHVIESTPISTKWRALEPADSP